MKPSVKKISAFSVAGISARTCNRDEANPGTAKLPALWGRFFMEEIAAKVPHAAPGAPIYGVYSAYDSDVSGPYTVTAGPRVTAPVGAGEFAQVDIRPGDYLVFEARGTMPQLIVD